MTEGTSSIDEAAKKTASHLDDLSKAAGNSSATLLSGIPTLKAAVGTLGNIIPFGGVLEKTIGYLEGQVDVYRALTRSGINFGGQLDRIQVAATQAGLSLEQFKSVMKDNSELFAALGSTANAGAEDFMANLNSFRTAVDTASGSNLRYSTQLRRLGQDFEDFAEQMGLIEQFQVMSARRTFMTDEQRNRATFEFSKELDILSKLTGKQNDELKKEMAARMREGDYQAFLAGLDPEEAKQVMLAQAQAEAAGFGDLFKDYMVRGFPSEDQRMLAGMSGDMVNLFSGMRSSLQNGDMSSFGAMTDEIMVTGAATQMANRELAMLGNTTRASTAAMQSFADSSPVMAKFRQMLNQEANARGISIRDIDRATRARIFNEAKAAAEAEQARQMGDSPDGDSKAVLDALLLGQERMVDLAASTQQQAIQELYQRFLTPAAREFVEKLNATDFNRLATQIGNEALMALYGRQGSGTPGPTPNITDAAFNDFMSNLGGRSDTAAGSPSDYAARIAEKRRELNNADAADRERLQDELDALIGEAADKFNITSPLSPGSATPSTDDITITTSGDVIVNGNIPPTNNGTLGAYGNVLHDFGRESLGLLHGREAILNEQQLNNLVAGTMQMGQQMRPAMENAARTGVSGLQGMLNNIRPQMQNMTNQMQPQMENFASQMAPMMKEMADSMQGPMKEMAESMRGPMESIAGNMQKSLGVASKQLRVQRMIPGNIFGGL